MIDRTPSVTSSPFGRLPSGDAVYLFHLESASGVAVSACSFGALITSILTPDRFGQPGQIALGHDTLEPYIGQTAYLGALVGRYANRIANGRFAIDGVPYQLATNDPPHHLHGGICGFDQRLWTAEPFSSAEDAGVRFHRISRAGEEHYPGELEVCVEYRLTASGSLHCTYSASSTAPTIVNLTQHTYFNLTASNASVLDHELTIPAARFTPVDAGLIPTGELAPVAGTPFDFQQPRRIGERINWPHEQLRHAGGYDHNWVLDGVDPIHRAATLYEPLSGRTIDIFTTQPGIQFYSGNFLDGTILGRHGAYGHRSGLCLETQRFPDTPNQSAFGTAVVRPQQRYVAETIFGFAAV